MSATDPTIKGDHSPNYRRLPRILFVSECTSARTAMAEYYMKKMGGDLLDVLTAGIEVTPLDKRAVKSMQADGFDIREYTGRVVSKDIMEWADIIIVLCEVPGKVHPYISTGSVRKDWPIPDPAQLAKDNEDVEAFNKVRDNIKRRVQQFINAVKLSRR
jgi:arsenate reductase (thioredoxin)